VRNYPHASTNGWDVLTCRAQQFSAISVQSVVFGAYVVLGGSMRNPFAAQNNLRILSHILRNRYEPALSWGNWFDNDEEEVRYNADDGYAGDEYHTEDYFYERKLGVR